MINMKVLVNLFFLPALIFVLSSCGQSTEYSEAGDTAVENDQRTDTPEEAERRALMRSEWSVEEIIEHWVNGLDERLTLSAEVRSGIREAYSNAYIETGGSLDDIINRDEARDLRQEIVRKTEEEVLEHLTEDQVKFYTRFYDNQ